MTDSSSLQRRDPEGPAGRDLQPRRAKSRGRQLSGARVHRQLRRFGHLAPARDHPHSRTLEENPLLPGLVLRAVRKGRRDPAARVDPVLSALALRRREALRVLDHRQLPRGLRPVRLQRHPFQPRVPAPGRDFRDAQDHARPRPDQARARGDDLAREPGGQARLGPRPGLRRDDVADAPAKRSPPITSSRPAASTRCGNSSRPPRASSTCRSLGKAREPPSAAWTRAPAGPSWPSTRATCARPRWRHCSATPPRPGGQLGWKAAHRDFAGARARDGPRADLRLARERGPRQEAAELLQARRAAD